VERGTVRVKCFAQEHNTVSLTRAQTQTALIMRPPWLHKIARSSSLKKSLNYAMLEHATALHTCEMYDDGAYCTYVNIQELLTRTAQNKEDPNTVVVSWKGVGQRAEFGGCLPDLLPYSGTSNLSW